VIVLDTFGNSKPNSLEAGEICPWVDPEEKEGTVERTQRGKSGNPARGKEGSGGGN